ncbi:MAG: thioredoxin family protein [Paludibacteraceae bacterium]|nr:thioredoxin family protein [Paludibacteraceae bacterium]
MRKICFRTLFVALCGMAVLLFSCSAMGGKKHNIKISAPELQNDTVYLGRYFMGKVRTLDSLVLDNKGIGAFKGGESLKEGIYVLYLKDGSYVDMLVGSDQTIDVKLDTLNMPYNVRFSKAKETEDFYKFSMFYFDKQKEGKTIASAVPQDATMEQRKEAMEKMQALGKAVKAKQDSLLKEYEGKTLALFLNGYQMVEPPEFTIPDGCANPDSARMAFYYAFFRDHYFDNVNLSDERTYYMPFIGSRLDTYLNRVLVQRYDSIIPQAINMVEMSRGSDSTFKIMANYMLGYATNYDLPGFLDMRHIMGIDNLIVELADRYYLNGEAFWADSALIEKVRKKADKIRYCQIGKPAQNIALADADSVYTPIYDMAGTKFTVLVFYEPDCGHCQKRLPIVSEYYKQFSGSPDVKVIAVCMTDDKQGWQNFIKEYKTENLINVWDPNRTSEYWKYYDTSETPMILVMDSDKNIIVRNIEPEVLNYFK